MQSGKAKKIKSQLVIDDADDKTKKTTTQPVSYIFNYEEGGYSIISADNRIEPILAIVEQGPGIDRKSNLPGGLILWMKATKDQIQNIRKVKLKIARHSGGRRDITVTQKGPFLTTN